MAFEGLKVGSRGEDVKALQLALKGAGLKVVPDSIYGSETARAVKTFGERRGLLEGASAAAKQGRVVTRDVAYGLNNLGSQEQLFGAAKRVTAELLQQDPRFLSLVDAHVRVIEAAPEAERSALITDAYADLTRYVEGKELSPSAKADWQAFTTGVDQSTAANTLLSEGRQLRDFIRRVRATRLETNIGLLTQDMVRVNPNVVSEILERADKIKALTQTSERTTELMAAVGDLDAYVNQHEAELGPFAKNRWVEIKANIEDAHRAEQLVPLAKVMHASFIRQTLRVLDEEVKTKGANPKSLELSEALSSRLNQLEEKAATNAAAPVTPQMLRAIVPKLSLAKATELAPHLDRAMAESGVVTIRQKAAFIAQTAHETAGYLYFRELGGPAYFTKYDNRGDLGNRGHPDGANFKGRGALQLTGRANYTAFSKAHLKSDELVRNPRLVETPPYAFASAAWFWNSRRLSAIADEGNFRLLTRRINGGYNGWNDRVAYYTRALGEFAEAR